MSKIEKPAQFALAGNAVFTLTSHATGARYTFKVRAAKEGPTHFVSVLTGPDNTQDYRYLGFLRRGVYFHGGAKAKIGRDAPSAKAFDWFWRNVSRGADLSQSCDVDHEGQCGRCGRPLTVPESIRSGFGPECVSKVCL
jgi:Family of unknown function (DUF6011)